MSVGAMQEMLEKMAAHGRSLFDRGLASGSSGNLSCMLADGTLLITPTKASMGRLRPEEIAQISPDGSHIGGKAPSKELFLHQSVYHARPAARAVVHLHATASAAVSCLAGLDEANCLPALTPYYVMKIGRLPLVPYARPGAEELADSVSAIARSHPAMLLSNHGPIVAGETLDEAIDRIEELEETAKLFMMLRGEPTRELDDGQIEDLKRVFGDVLDPGEQR